MRLAVHGSNASGRKYNLRVLLCCLQTARRRVSEATCCDKTIACRLSFTRRACCKSEALQKSRLSRSLFSRWGIVDRGPMSKSPFCHRPHNRSQCIAQFCESVFSLRGNHRVLAARDQPPLFHFPSSLVRIRSLTGGQARRNAENRCGSSRTSAQTILAFHLPPRMREVKATGHGLGTS